MRCSDAAAPAGLRPPRQPNRNRFPRAGQWDQEVLYVAEVRGELSPDISDEIVKRLNAADEAKGKASSAPTK